MSTPEGFFVLKSESTLKFNGDKLMVKKTAKGDLGGVTRKRLSDSVESATRERVSLHDVSNLPHQPNSLTQDKKEQFISNTTKQYIDQLQKENMMLVKLLAERNNIIETSGIQLQKMRIDFQKMQQQNSQLAQANSQMLAELNSGKDRLKALNHALGCKNGLLKAMKLELQEKVNRRKCQNMDDQERTKEATVSSEAVSADNKHCHTTKNQPLKEKQNELNEKIENKRSISRRQSASFKSKEPEASEGRSFSRQSAGFKSNEPNPNNEEALLNVENGKQSRSISRRQSARFKAKEPEASEGSSFSRRQSAGFKSNESDPNNEEDLFEIDDVKFPVSSLDGDQLQGDTSTSTCLLDEKDDKVGRGSTDEIRRSSIGRPLRQAAQKVQSYKEIAVNVKMRRIE
ncbi:hypothetical protein NMG60_11018683 [Bertholletia excelsa]